ncbi:hypothetical protein [Tannerella forsythia]|uniref:hypothetical protein n=1 Tax=Tannerella forsythia TaxID=28112 RepID=UPI001639A8FF|nr:hypothetical protein [Tannerella forsythia]
MSLKKRFSLWAMLAIALAFCQPLKAENYGAEVSTDGASVDVSQLYSNPPTATTNIKSRIVVKNGVPFSITLPANSNPSGVNGATLSGTTIQVSEAGSVSFYHHKDGITVSCNTKAAMRPPPSTSPSTIKTKRSACPQGSFRGLHGLMGLMKSYLMCHAAQSRYLYLNF